MSHQARSGTGESVQETFRVLRNIVAKLPDLVSVRPSSTTRVQHVQEALDKLDWPRWQALHHTWPSLARSIVKNLEALVDPKIPNVSSFALSRGDVLTVPCIYSRNTHTSLVFATRFFSTSFVV